MKVDNFKELLLKKAEDNPNLQLLIKYMRDEYLVDHVSESLEKMARIYSKKNPNAAVMHFGTHMDPETEGDMIYDALSHHASHYKAALRNGKENIADSHMKKIFQIMHMSDKLTRDGLNDHSHGKLNIEAVDPKPWERSGYSKKNEKTGKFSTDTKGWGRHGSNYDWLRGEPHEAYAKETDVHGHKGAYPLEHIKVNGRYIDIDDVDPSHQHEPHAFDHHPIMEHYKARPGTGDTHHNEDKHSKYLTAHDDYHDSEHIENYWNKVDERGDRHYNRGADPSQSPHSFESNAKNIDAAKIPDNLKHLIPKADADE